MEYKESDDEEIFRKKGITIKLKSAIRPRRSFQLTSKIFRFGVNKGSSIHFKIRQGASME